MTAAMATFLALNLGGVSAILAETPPDPSSVNWDEAYLEGSLGRECPFFEPGEEMVFSLRLKRAKGEIPPDMYFVDWERKGDDGVEEKGRAPLPTDDEPLVIRAKSDKPGFVRIVANVVTADGERVKSKIPWEKRVFFEGGAAVAPETLKPGTEPDDYDAFWESQMARLDAMPIKAELTPTNCADTAVRLYAVRIDCAGPRPVTGWLTMPSDASPEKRYPVEVNFRGASMDDQPAPKGGPHDHIRFMSNGHGFDLGRGPEYVKEFFAGFCKPGGIYGFDDESNRKRDDSYWLGMALRAIRAAQWAATLPEWDGKSLELTGGSQGGWQSLMAAARCHSVTKITTGVTWGCDWTGQAEYKRIRSRYRPGCWYPDMAYFDAVFAAKRVTCPVSIGAAGLGDYVSPPSSLAVLYNCLSVPKKIVWLQGKTHGFTPPNVAKWVVDGGFDAAVANATQEVARSTPPGPLGATPLSEGGSGVASRIRWFNGEWDGGGAPRGKLLTTNPRWFGDRVFTGVTYEWETPPTWPKDMRTQDGKQVPANRLFNGFGSNYYPENGCVGREGDVPIVAVFDFKRPCSFTEVDLVALHCTNATGSVEFSDDKASWHGRHEFTTASAITRVRFGAAVPSQESPLREGGGPERAGGSTASGRYMRLSFQATPEAVDDWYKKGRRGYTYLDEVYAWGEGEVSAEFPEAIVPINPGGTILFTNAAHGVVSILPMPIPHLSRKPAGATPELFPMTMARNETETRYFAIVNGTESRQCVSLSATGFGEGVQAELLVGGVMQVSPPKRKLSPEEMILLATNDENGINQGGPGDLDLVPFFFAEARPKENFLRRYLANPAQIAGFPDAVPLAPGEGCVVMLRLTTDGTAPGRWDGIVRASDAALTIPLTIVDLMLPPQSMWIYAYEPFTRQVPFEPEGRMKRDVERYAGIGATTTMKLPEPGTKERLFFDLLPQASVGSPQWCDAKLYKRVAKGEFDTLTEAERAKIADGARAFLERGRALGLSDNRICAFLPDEPGVRNGKSVMSLARLVKDAVPELLLHCDPLFFNGGGKGFSTTDELKSILLPEYNECVDISQPISYFSTREDAMRDLWLQPRRINAMYNHPAGRMGSEMVYTCYRHGFNGIAYYCYCHPGIEVWDINRWGVLNLNYQAVMPLGEDVALTPLYEFLREAAETARMLDALKAAGKNEVLADVLKRSETAWDRTHFQYDLQDPSAEDILALRETILNAFGEKLK